MTARPTESPLGNGESTSREKIRQILEIAQEVVRKDPLAIMQKVERIIGKPKMNSIARLLSLVVAEDAPEILIDNEHVIRGQRWKDAVLRIAMTNMTEESD